MTTIIIIMVLYLAGMILIGLKGRKYSGSKKEICRDAVFLYREGLLLEMKKYDITVLSETECLDAGSGEVKLGDGTVLKADTVIAATGFLPREDEAEALRSHAFEFWKIGDCYQVRRVFNAMREGYNAGNYVR